MTVTFGISLAKKSGEEEAIHEWELLMRVLLEAHAPGAMPAGLATLPHAHRAVAARPVKATASNHRPTEGWLVSTHARSKYLWDDMPLLIHFCNLAFSTIEINLLSTCTKWAKMGVLTQFTLTYSFDMRSSAIPLRTRHFTVIAITVRGPAFGVQRPYWFFGLNWNLPASKQAGLSAPFTPLRSRALPAFGAGPRRWPPAPLTPSPDGCLDHSNAMKSCHGKHIVSP